MRLLFGHQSVGDNIVQGLTELPSQNRPELEISPLAEVSPGTASVLCHFRAGVNGDPDSKLADLRRTLEDNQHLAFNAVLLKFCYVDLTETRDAEPLFGRYLAWIEDLRRRFPELAILHSTIPLRCASPGLASSVRRALGQPDPQLDRNAARHRFNELLREHYAGGRALFDLARIEARGEESRELTYRNRGTHVPALRPQLSPDGGHLDVTGRRIVARHFAALLQELRGDA